MDSPFKARNALDRRRIREAFSVDENQVGWYRKSLELQGSPPPPPTGGFDQPEVVPAPGMSIVHTCLGANPMCQAGQVVKPQLTDAEKRIVVARWIATVSAAGPSLMLIGRTDGLADDGPRSGRGGRGARGATLV